MNIRTASASDIPALKRIWSEIFGDSDDFLNLFFTQLFSSSNAFVAEENGKIIGSAYILNIYSLKIGVSELPCPYIYAVGVLNDYRGQGIGKQLTLFCHRHCAETGSLSCLVPSSAELFNYYRRAAGYSSAFYISEFETTPKNISGAKISMLGSEEYGQLRESFLSPLPHLKLSFAGLKFWQKLCLLQGGGFYLISFPASYAIAACEQTAGELCIKELLCSNYNQAEDFATALLCHFSQKLCRFRTPQNSEHPENTMAFGMLSSFSFNTALYFGAAFD